MRNNRMRLDLRRYDLNGVNRLFLLLTPNRPPNESTENEGQHRNDDVFHGFKDPRISAAAKSKRTQPPFPMDQKPPNFLLNKSKSAHTRLFLPQPPRSHSDRRKSRSQCRVLLNLR